MKHICSPVGGEYTRGRHLAIEHTKLVFRKIHTKATVFRSIADQEAGGAPQT